jgi:hypothetical protein
VVCPDVVAILPYAPDILRNAARLDCKQNVGLQWRDAERDTAPGPSKTMCNHGFALRPPPVYFACQAKGASEAGTSRTTAAALYEGNCACSLINGLGEKHVLCFLLRCLLRPLCMYNTTADHRHCMFITQAGNWQLSIVLG